MKRDRVIFIGAWLIFFIGVMIFTKIYFSRVYIFEKNNMCYRTYSCYKKNIFDFRCRYKGKTIEVERYTRLK